MSKKNGIFALNLSISLFFIFSFFLSVTSSSKTTSPTKLPHKIVGDFIQNEKHTLSASFCSDWA